jgi:hypothetical protein
MNASTSLRRPAGSMRSSPLVIAAFTYGMVVVM